MPDPSLPTCVADGCDRPVYIRKRGLCRRCYMRDWKARRPDRVAEHNRRRREPEHPCLGGCGALVPAKQKRCEPCMRQHRRRHYAQARSRRDAQKRGRAGGERVDVLIVAQRDDWTCHLCGLPVTEETWSIDHLVPLADGGTHTYSNVAIAHHRCNARRGRRPLG